MPKSHKFKILFVLTILISFINSKQLVNTNIFSDSVIFPKFKQFIQTYHKSYPNYYEYFKRYKIFKSNLENNLLTNSLYSDNTKGITLFSDITPDEFKKQILTLNVPLLTSSNIDNSSFRSVNAPTLSNTPSSFNWVNLGVTSSIKDQGLCGSCWAFTTATNIEALYYIKYGKRVDLSEQQMVDCDNYDYGCQGGSMLKTYQWIKANGGLMLENEYPYTGQQGTCRQNQFRNAVRIIGYEKLISTNEIHIRNYLLSRGPIAAALNGIHLQFYTSGIIDKTSSECDPYSLNHAVVIVGYGSENGKDYWIVQNSFGSQWGENGYFRIARGKGSCGINLYISSAIIE